VRIPFCPNHDCRLHYRRPAPAPRWFQRFGTYPTRRFGLVQRFRCCSCGRLFSTQTFAISYYEKKRVSIRQIANRLCSGEGLRAIGRGLGVSSEVVSNRISRLARSRMAAHCRLTRTIRLNEALAADGFETFTHSQFFPEHITLAVGERSQFLYLFNHCILKRKGRMTEAQETRRDLLQKAGAYPLVRLSTVFGNLLEELCSQLKLTHPLGLFTDEHPAYRLAVRRCAAAIHHVRIPSKLPRTRSNPLFPVNYYDRELRKDLAAQHRESVCFSREVNRNLERIVVYGYYHNYEKPYRVRGSLNDRSLRHSCVAGLDRRLVETATRRSYRERGFFHRSPLSWFFRQLWTWRLFSPQRSGWARIPSYVFS
jgi:transposase-like protein